MKLYKIIPFYVILVFFALSCNKEEIDNNTYCSNGDYCPVQYQSRSEPYPDTFHKSNKELQCIVSPQQEYLEEYTYKEPVLNPNNSFEFAFIREKPYEIQPTRELCIYNFCNNTIEVITDKAFYGVDWSKKNWLIFTGNDYQVYKIKANGDSLTQLTNSGIYNNDPKWSPSGESYIYFDNENSVFRLCDDDGNSLNTYSVSMDYYDWIDDSSLVYTNSINGQEYQVRKFNLQTGTQELIHSITQQGSGEPISYENDQILFTANDGLFEISNNSVNLVDTNYLTYSSGYPQRLSNSKILLQRFITDTTYYEDCIVYGGTYVSILDEQTGEERRIKIPE